MKNLHKQPNQNELKEIENLFNLNKLDIVEKKTRKLIDKYPKISVLYNILGVVLQKKNNFIYLQRNLVQLLIYFPLMKIICIQD